MTRRVVVLASAAMIVVAPGVAYADNIAQASEPTATVTEPATSPEADATPGTPSPSPIDTIPVEAQLAHVGGM